MNEKFKDLNVVRILAQKAANALSVDMIIYKIMCDGIQIFKFSENWQGQKVEIVHHDRGNTSENILPNTSDWRSITTKGGPKERKGNLE